LITINFYKDGAYVTGHDVMEICRIVSYCMWACIEDCLSEDKDIWYYESGNDDNHKQLGFTYFKINSESEVHKKIYKRFKENSTFYTNVPEHEIAVNERLEELINWDIALADAKSLNPYS
jgi:hypothetical protein